MIENHQRLSEHFKEGHRAMHFPHIVEHVTGALWSSSGDLNFTHQPTIVSVVITREDFKEHCKKLKFEDDLKEVLK